MTSKRIAAVHTGSRDGPNARYRKRASLIDPTALPRPSLTGACTLKLHTEGTTVLPQISTGQLNRRGSRLSLENIYRMSLPLSLQNGGSAREKTRPDGGPSLRSAPKYPAQNLAKKIVDKLQTGNGSSSSKNAPTRNNSRPVVHPVKEAFVRKQRGKIKQVQSRTAVMCCS